MLNRSILFMLMIAALVTPFGIKEARAGLPAPPGVPAPPGLPGPPGVNVSIGGYVPAPPGVFIRYDAGRPYYVERGHRVYLKKRHHHDHGHKYGHYKHGRHGD